ncbi:hypothetical protein Tco_0692470 [Tanacetum coccineum]
MLRNPREQTKVRNSCNKPFVANKGEVRSLRTPGIYPEVEPELKDNGKAVLSRAKKNQPKHPLPVSQAAAANFNQGNTGYRALIANQIRPPGFPPVQNQGNNQNRYNQNRGNNYNQGQIYRPPINQPPVHQAPLYQDPAPQTQGVTKTDFESYVKANDAVMRNIVNSNTASTSGGVSYQGPTIPTTSSSPPKVVERETEVTKDTVPPTNNGLPEDV